MVFRPLDYSSFISPAHFMQSTGSIADTMLQKQRQTELKREFDTQEERRNNEFQTEQDFKEQGRLDELKKSQRDFDEQLTQHKQAATQFMIGQILADPTKGMAYAPALEARGVHVVPKEDGTVEFIDAQGNPVQGPPRVGMNMDGNPVGPQAAPFAIKPTLPGAKPWDAPLPKASTDMDGNPVQTAAAAPQAAAQQGQVPAAAVSANAPMPGESAEAFLKRSAASMEGMTEDQQLAALEQAQNAPSPPDEPESPQEAAVETPQTERQEHTDEQLGISKTPEGADLAAAIRPEEYEGTDEEEAAANQRIDRALSTGGPEAPSGVPEASGDQHYANAAAKAEAIAQKVQTQTPVPGRSYGSIDLKAIQDHNVQGAQAIMNGFISGLPQGQDKEWADQVTKQAVTEFGINTPEKAMEAIKDPVFKYIIARGNQEAMMAAARSKGAGGEKAPTLGATHDDLETLITHYEGKFNVGDMHKRQDSAAKVQNLIASPNPLAQREALTAELKNMFSSVTSDRELGFLQSAGGKLNQIESKFNEFFSGGELPANYRELLAQASQIVDQGTADALKRAAENAGAYIQKDPTLTMSGPARRQAAAIVMGRFTGNFGNAPNLEGPMPPAGATAAPDPNARARALLGL